MVQCIACIIGHNLFNLKLIRPYIYRFCFFKNHSCFFLFDHNMHRTKYTPDQRYNVKSFHHRGIFTGLQLIQRQQVFDQLVHLWSLIHNNFTVKFPAFRIIGNIFIQPLCISLDQCNRSFQLMRNIIKKFLTHLINFNLIFYVFLKLVISRFQLWDRALKFSGHFVKVIAKYINLITCPALISGIKIQIRHLLW